MEFRILGPVEAYDDGRRIDLGRRRERSLLALLLLPVGSVKVAGFVLPLAGADAAPARAAATALRGGLIPSAAPLV